VTVPHLQRPREAGTLNVTRAAQRDRGVRRLTRSREEHLWIDTLTYTASTPRHVPVLAFLKGTQQTGITTRRRDLVRAWHSRPSHAPTSPVGSNRGVIVAPRKDRNRRRAGDRMTVAGAVFY